MQYLNPLINCYIYSEEILATHPEILEDVKKESERMMNERNRLLEQLQKQQQLQ